MAEVVEAERPECRSRERGSVALGERGAVEVAADDAGEDEGVLVGEVLALAEPRERLGDLVEPGIAMTVQDLMHRTIMAGGLWTCSPIWNLAGAATEYRPCLLKRQ